MIRAPFEAADPDEVFGWWHERFGGGFEQFAGLGCYRRGRTTIWVASEEVVLAGLQNIDGVGVPFVRVGGRDWKPTTVAAQQFGGTATRGVVEVTNAEAVTLMRRGSIEVPEDDTRRPLPASGFGIARYRGVPMGCIEWRPALVQSCIPKGRAIADLDLA